LVFQGLTGPRLLRLFVRCASAAIPLFLVVSFCAADGAQLSATKRSGVVSRVIDGDTFDLKTGERVRLIGVDAPEYEPWKGRIDPYGREASQFLRALLSGQPVLLEEDMEVKDKYGRTLAYVYLAGGEFVNLKIVQEGLARVKRYLPNQRYHSLFKTAEKEAKSKKKNVWSEQSPSKLLAKRIQSN
jgi:micrococcal nuclease